MNHGEPESSANQPRPIIGNCLSCQGLVRIPAHTAANAEVRCPHCESSFSLATILEQAVPELEVVAPNSAVNEPDLKIDTGNRKKSAEVESLEDFVVPSQLSKGARRRRRRKRKESEPSSPRSETQSSDSSLVNSSLAQEPNAADSEITESPRESSLLVDDDFENDPPLENQDALIEPVNVDVAESAPPKPKNRRAERRERQRESRRESSRRRNASRGNKPARNQNPLVEIIKVLFGAFLAIPIAYLFVFWIFNRDPLNVGPSISEVAPFLVPEEFRGEAEADEDDASPKSGEENLKPLKNNSPLNVDPDKGLAIPSLDPDSLGR